MTDYNPFVERNIKHPTTDLETVIHLCKGSLGSGILAMPQAFKNLGLWLGIPGTLLIGLVCTYCIHMLVKASQTLCFRCKVPMLSYAETVELTFRNDPKELIKLAKIMRFIVNFFLVIDLLGCVCIYLVNVGRNIGQIFDLHFPGNGITLRYWILILAAPLVFLCLIRDLKYLVPFSLIANILMFLGLIITFTFIFRDLPRTDERDAVKPLEKWPIFFGTGIFALENIGLVLPCENEMKNPEHFTGCPSVLVIAMSFVVSLYTLLGFFGFLKYGDLTEANVTLNLPTENVWAQVAKVFVAVAVYLTILLQFYVPINIIWQGMAEKVPEKWQLCVECVTRIFLMLLCTGVAVAFPDLGPFISLVGALCLSTLGLIMPALLDIVVFRNDPGWGCLKFHLIKDILIILFGILGLLTGTFVSIKEFKI